MHFPLFKEHTRREPTWMGWLLIATLIALLFSAFLLNIYDFLAPSAPPREGLMVVEGWINDDALEEAAALYKEGNYSRLACSGVPIETGSYLLPFKSYSEMTAARLQELGIAETDLLVATAVLAPKDRTYLAAVALREKLQAENITETRIHLISTGPHGRRSRLLFTKALGEDYQVGITCLPDTDYNPECWYTYSQGVRKVISECIAYVYAKLFFHP